MTGKKGVRSEGEMRGEGESKRGRKGERVTKRWRDKGTMRLKDKENDQI